MSILISRRGFLKTILAATAVVFTEIRLLKGLPNVNPEGRNYTFERATEHYSYGMDRMRPWDVIIYRTDKHGAPQRIVTVDEIHEKSQKQFKLSPAGGFDHMADIEEFETEAIIGMSQGMCGYQLLDKPTFSSPMRDLDEPVQLRIYTTSKEFFADA